MRIDDTDFENDVDLIDNRSEYRGPVSYNEPLEKVCDSADRVLTAPRSSDKLLLDQLIKENRMKEQAVEKASNLIELLTMEVLRPARSSTSRRRSSKSLRTLTASSRMTQPRLSTTGATRRTASYKKYAV